MFTHLTFALSLTSVLAASSPQCDEKFSSTVKGQDVEACTMVCDNLYKGKKLSHTDYLSCYKCCDFREKDHCEPNPCHEYAKCDAVGRTAFKCTCAEPVWTGNGKSCHHRDPATRAILNHKGNTKTTISGKDWDKLSDKLNDRDWVLVADVVAPTKFPRDGHGQWILKGTRGGFAFGTEDDAEFKFGQTGNGITAIMAGSKKPLTATPGRHYKVRIVRSHHRDYKMYFNGNLVARWSEDYEWPSKGITETIGGSSWKINSLVIYEGPPEGLKL
eukprot:TRINITY_DN1121_c0_g1_i1.p2 TRINITY_DN1121_c0_g1~~TRINITY_DN1121_c0_g1_i1.p2  ORF type:complete len:273 (-),score=85.55 TRINITY_DN1121_c0_g1_i1:122-940(-)